MNEIRVKVSLKNNRLVAVREKMEMTQAQFAEYLGVSMAHVGLFETLQKSPLGQDGCICDSASAYLEAFDKDIDYFWPGELATEKLRKATAYFAIGLEEARALASGAEERMLLAETKERIEDALDTLSPREALVIRERFWNEATLRDCGVKMGVSVNRARQLEARALRKLRTPKRAKIIRGDSNFPDIESENKHKENSK